MNRKKGKDFKKANKNLVDYKDLERNVLTEISKEFTEKPDRTPKKENK